MKLWEFLEKEQAALEKRLGFNPLAERVWRCDPLLVVDDSDNTVAYFGCTNVDVVPRSTKNADLTAEAERDGWHPSLINAEVRLFEGYTNASQTNAIGSYRRSGVVCRGVDAEGFQFTWYVNGAADDHSPDATGFVEPDEPTPEKPSPE